MSLKTILIIVACIGGAIAICLLLGYFGVYPFTEAYAYVTGALASNNINLESVTTNPTALLTTAGAGITAATAVGIPLYNKLNAAKTQATQLKASADKAYDDLKSEKEELAAKVSGLESQTKSIADLKVQAEKAGGLQTELNKLQTNFDSISQQKTSYQNQFEEVKAQLKTAQDQLAVLKPQVK